MPVSSYFQRRGSGSLKYNSASIWNKSKSKKGAGVEKGLGKAEAWKVAEVVARAEAGARPEARAGARSRTCGF